MSSGKNDNRKKPSKKKRVPPTENTRDTSDQPPPSEPRGRKEKQAKEYKESVDVKQRLRDKIKSLQKDRAKGSYVCEENANYEY